MTSARRIWAASYWFAVISLVVDWPANWVERCTITLRAWAMDLAQALGVIMKRSATVRITSSSTRHPRIADQPADADRVLRDSQSVADGAESGSR